MRDDYQAPSTFLRLPGSSDQQQHQRLSRPAHEHAHSSLQSDPVTEQGGDQTRQQKLQLPHQVPAVQSNLQEPGTDMVQDHGGQQLEHDTPSRPQPKLFTIPSSNEGVLVSLPRHVHDSFVQVFWFEVMHLASSAGHGDCPVSRQHISAQGLDHAEVPGSAQPQDQREKENFTSSTRPTNP